MYKSGGGDAVRLSSLCQKSAISSYVGALVPVGRAQRDCGRRERVPRKSPVKCIENHMIGGGGGVCSNLYTAVRTVEDFYIYCKLTIVLAQLIPTILILIL